MKNQLRRSGRFASPYAERRGNPISFRLPLSLDAELRLRSGWRSKFDNRRLHLVIEAALRQYLEVVD